MSIDLLCANIGLFCVIIGLFCVNIGLLYKEIPWGVFICRCDVTHLNTFCVHGKFETCGKCVLYIRNTFYVWRILQACSFVCVTSLIYEYV